MARKVKECYRELPKDTHDALMKTKHLGSSASLKYLRNKKVTVVTPISNVRKIVKIKSKKYKVPIVVSAKPMDSYTFRGKTFKKADGLAFEYPKPKIYIHLKVFRKKKGIQKPRNNKIRVVR